MKIIIVEIFLKFWDVNVYGLINRKSLLIWIRILLKYTKNISFIDRFIIFVITIPLGFSKPLYFPITIIILVIVVNSQKWVVKPSIIRWSLILQSLAHPASHLSPTKYLATSRQIPKHQQTLPRLHPWNKWRLRWGRSDFHQEAGIQRSGFMSYQGQSCHISIYWFSQWFLLGDL